MITHIEIDGFKSLQKVSLDLEPLTAVFGANGSGKSNLFDALQLLSALSHGDLTTAFKSTRGRTQDQFARIAPEASATRMTLAVEVLLPRRSPWADRAFQTVGQVDALRHTRLRYEVTIERRPEADGTETLDIPDEWARAISPTGDAWTARRTAFACFSSADEERAGDLLRMHRNDQTNGLEMDTEFETVGAYPLPIKTARTISPAPLRVSTFLSNVSLEVQPHLAALRAELASWRFLQLDTQGLRAPSDRAGSRSLLPDGSNLPTAIAALAPEVRGLVRADMAALLPGFRSFDVVPKDDGLVVEVEFNDGQRVPARVLSDGTLRLLATIVLLRSVSPGTFVAIEEPENGIHPGRLRALVDRLRALTTSDGDALPIQVLVNSHSPVLLAALHDHPESIVLADLVRHGTGGRVTRVRHVDPGGGGGQPQASLREVERILETAHVEAGE